MDMSALAEMMLKAERVRTQLDELEAAIKGSVLQLGKTQSVGNVRASYSAGRKSYDYKGAAAGHPMVSDATVSLFSKQVTTTDWRKLCEHVGIDDAMFTQSAPSVSIKYK